MTGITTIGNDKSYYHGLLHIDNTDLNVTSADEVSFGLNDSDTILINKDKNPTISLAPQLYRVKGLISEVIPYNEVSNVLFTYSYYDNEVLVTTNVNIDYYSLAGDLTDILSEVGLLNPVYIKCNVLFTYRSNTIQQGFELYFLNNSLYTSILSNLNYYVSGYIDKLNGQIAELKCGCLLLTNLYDIYKTIEVVENNQTVVKGIADIVPNTKVRMGNLTGIHNYTFGKNQPKGYGLYGESVYLTGNFYLNNGRSLVDIDRDILLAVGNIKEVERYLKSLESSVRATIEANSIITEANYTGAISINNNSLLRLGLDYSLWALGNAGIVLMNPNATYNVDGEVEPSTIGDGDESILLLGNKIMFATNKTFTYDNIKYYEMICTQSSPTGWTYNGSIYNPLNVLFFVLYISESSFSSINNSIYRKQIDRLDGNTTELYLRYVGFSSITDVGTTENDVTTPTLFSATNSPNECYLFNNYFEYSESNISTNNIFFIKKSDNTLESYTPTASIYMNLRIIDSGVFRDGHLRVKNLVAVESGNENLNFDPEVVISDNNHPVTGNNNYTNGTNVPFVVISGTNGKITTQGMDLKEATVGNPNDKHIHITDNTGILEDLDNYPGMYIKNNTDLVAKFSGDSSNNPLDVFDTRGRQTISGTGIIYQDLILSLISFDKTFDRSLSFCTNSLFSNYTGTKIGSGFRIVGTEDAPSSLFLSQPYTSNSNLVAKYKLNPSDNWSNLEQTSTYFRKALVEGPYSKVYIAVPEDNSINNGLGKYGIHILRGSISSEESYNTNNTEVINGQNYHVRVFNLKGDDSSTPTASIKINYPRFSEDNFQTSFDDTIPYDNDIYEVNYSPSDDPDLIELPLLEITILGKKSKIIYLDSANISCSNFTITGYQHYTLNNTEYRSYKNQDLLHTPKPLNTLPKIFNESVSIIAEFYYTDNNQDKVLFKRECSVLNIKLYMEDDEFSKKYYITSNILKNSGDIFYNSFPSNSPVVIYNNTSAEKTYNIKLRIKLLFTGDRSLSSYKWIKRPNSSNPDYHTLEFDINHLEICDELEQCEQYSSLDDYIAAGGSIPKPTDDYYTWNPARSAYQYRFLGTVSIGNYKLYVQDNTFETLIQGNGFGTGFNKFNKFGVYYDNRYEHNPKFTFDLKSNKNGLLFNKDGTLNIISNFEINRYVPILQGNISYAESKYTFSGVSLNFNNSTIADNNCYQALGFKYDSNPSGFIIENFSYWDNFNVYPTSSNYASYSPRHDIYLIKANTGKLIIVFGEMWNNVFNSDTFSFDLFFVYLFSRGSKMYIPILVSINNNGNTITLKINNQVYKYINNKYWMLVNIINPLATGTNELLVDGDLSISVHYTPNNV